MNFFSIFWQWSISVVLCVKFIAFSMVYFNLLLFQDYTNVLPPSRMRLESDKKYQPITDFGKLHVPYMLSMVLKYLLWLHHNNEKYLIC